MTELKIGDRNPIFRLLEVHHNAKIDGKTKYARLFIKRIGWEYYQGLDEDGSELWEVELDNADEEDYEWFMGLPNRTDLGSSN